MSETIVPSILVVGGGTAGWMTAAALAQALNGRVRVTVVESDEIGTVGVGEATIPMILRFMQMLGIDEAEFLRETQATLKLGIEFVDWARIGSRYMHGFGQLREDIRVAPFEQVWLKLHRMGLAGDLASYSVTKCAAYAGRCMRPRLDATDSPLADIAYAFHFDASLFARYLRRYSERKGVQRVEGKVVDVGRDPDEGPIRSVTLHDGRLLPASFFVDCSGFRGLLIEDVYHVGYEEWSRWLPCDSAVAVASASHGPLLPYTRASAREAGWQWRIPLQHRVGNGLVYSSRYIDDDRARATLLENVEGAPLAEPRVLRFVPGMRRRTWIQNCVAVGLSAGFLEPLESTSIHLIQSGISRLLAHFPGQGICDSEIDEYNRQTRLEFEHVRDFVILHYHATERRDTPFWRDCAAARLPDSLERRIEMFRERGRLPAEPGQLFAYGNWFQVMCGQGIEPRSYDPLVDTLDVGEVGDYLRSLRSTIDACVEYMPTHEAFLGRELNPVIDSR